MARSASDRPSNSHARKIYTFDELIELITRRPVATHVWAVDTWKDVMQDPKCDLPLPKTDPRFAYNTSGYRSATEKAVDDVMKRTEL